MKSLGLRKPFIIDAHTHVYATPIYTTKPQDRAPEASRLQEILRGFLEAMDRYSLGMAAASSITPMVSRVWMDRYGGNLEVLELMRLAPERVIGQYVPNVFEAPELLQEKLREAFEELGFRGIKFHPWLSALPANDPLLHPVFEFAARHGLSVLFHSGTAPLATPLLVADIAMRYPEVPVIMGHMGKHELYLDTIPAARLSENVYLEISGCEIQALLEKAVRELGAQRLLFGDDGPGSRIPSYVARIEDLNVSPEEKEMILWRNAAGIFKVPRDTIEGVATRLGLALSLG